jgi:hypothetical protein
MLKFLFLVASFFILSLVLADSGSAVWGKIVHSDKTIKGVNYKYFVFYREGEISHAYPIEATTQQMSKLVNESVGQNVRINGHVKEVTLKIDGPKKQILVFIPTEIKPLTLSELAVSNTFIPDPKMAGPQAEKPGYDGGGIRINDKVANGLIYTGAAIILGTKISELLSKKR